MDVDDVEIIIYSSFLAQQSCRTVLSLVGRASMIGGRRRIYDQGDNNNNNGSSRDVETQDDWGGIEQQDVMFSAKCRKPGHMRCSCTPGQLEAWHKQIVSRDRRTADPG